MEINKDAFSSGQISSKIWLCEELEKINHISKLTWIYGGWYSVTAFLLFTRGKYNVEQISSFDLDQSVEEPSRLLNENWVCNGGRFQSFTCDCNYIMPVVADCIINTSTEHFQNKQWFDNIPKGTLVILQGNNMNHDDHVSHFTSLEDYISHFPLTETLYTGELDFTYPDWGFTRYMLIGRK
jgi:hypothetical protein